jgi:hypothetical protein
MKHLACDNPQIEPSLFPVKRPPEASEGDRNRCPSLLDPIQNNSTEVPPCSPGGLVERCGQVGRFIPLRCKRWDCHYCARKNWRKLWRRFKDSGVNFNRMMTLPFHLREDRTWETAIAESGSTLNKFFTSLRRVIPTLRYFWVREVGERNHMVHFHVMVSRYIPLGLISALWESAGGGYVCDIRKKGQGYALKYLAKYPELPDPVRIALKGKKKYATSRGLLVKVTLWRSEGQWVFCQVPPWKVYGCVVEEIKDGVYYFRDNVPRDT